MAMLKFTIEFSIDEGRVAKGFFLTAKLARLWLAPPHSATYESKARIIKTPDLKRVAKLQGYKTVKAFKASLVE